LALSEHLPHVSRHLYQVFKSASQCFNAQYILERTGNRNLLTIALRYPICTIEVLDALCRHCDSARLKRTVTQLPRRLFRSLTLDGRPSEWTEDHHPLPFLRHLFDIASVSIFETYGKQYYYELVQAGRAGFLRLLLFLYARLNYFPYEFLRAWQLSRGTKQFLAQGDVNVNSRGHHIRNPRPTTPSFAVVERHT